MKPDNGVGAAGAKKITNEEELKNNWEGLVRLFLSLLSLCGIKYNNREILSWSSLFREPLRPMMA
jgi:hypothetical protein